MKTISFFRRTFFFSLLIATPLLFSQCGGSEDYKENEGNENINEDTREENQVREQATGSAGNNGENASNREQETGFPDEKVQDNTNLTDNRPLELQTDEYQSLDKQILLATLNRQKNMIEYHIEALQSDTGNLEGAIDASADGASVQQLETQLQKLDQEIAKVRNTSAEELGQVAESAQVAIEEAGNLVVSNRMQVQLGF